MVGQNKFYTTKKNGERTNFGSYNDAKTWVTKQPEYPQGLYHIYPTERTGSAKSNGRKAHGE